MSAALKDTNLGCVSHEFAALRSCLNLDWSIQEQMDLFQAVDWALVALSPSCALGSSKVCVQGWKKVNLALLEMRDSRPVCSHSQAPSRHC